jgi:hypothetical protein
MSRIESTPRQIQTKKKPSAQDVIRPKLTAEQPCVFPTL